MCVGYNISPRFEYYVIEHCWNEGDISYIRFKSVKWHKYKWITAIQHPTTNEHQSHLRFAKLQRTHLEHILQIGVQPSSLVFCRSWLNLAQEPAVQNQILLFNACWWIYFGFSNREFTSCEDYVVIWCHLLRENMKHVEDLVQSHKSFLAVSVLILTIDLR